MATPSNLESTLQEIHSDIKQQTKSINTLTSEVSKIQTLFEALDLKNIRKDHTVVHNQLFDAEGKSKVKEIEQRLESIEKKFDSAITIIKTIGLVFGLVELPVLVNGFINIYENAIK